MAQKKDKGTITSSRKNKGLDVVRFDFAADMLLWVSTVIL